MQNISYAIDLIRQLETAAYEYLAVKSVQNMDKEAFGCVLSYLKSLQYSDFYFNVTTGTMVDDFVSFVSVEKPVLHEMIYPYIVGQVYSNIKDWTGWTGDLATGIKDCYVKAEDAGSTDYEFFTVLYIGSTLISCNYSDLCTDSDAIKISELVTETNNWSLADAMEDYYSYWYDCRYSYLYGRMAKNLFGYSEIDFNTCVEKVYNYFKGVIDSTGLRLLH